MNSVKSGGDNVDPCFTPATYSIHSVYPSAVLNFFLVFLDGVANSSVKLLSRS